MGYPMAGHLLRKGGHEVTVYNRTSAKAQQWAKEYGGKHAPTPREAARDCDFVMMCVGNDDDVRSVVYGADGTLAGMKKGAVLVDHTTASAILAKELHAKCKEKGIGFVDAPVSGGQAGAQNAQLGIMCGGEAADFDRAKPVIDVYAKMAALIGSPGAGQLTKMVNQICIAGLVQGLAEALSFAKRSGLDVELWLTRPDRVDFGEGWVTWSGEWPEGGSSFAARWPRDRALMTLGNVPDDDRQCLRFDCKYGAE
jgi:3-hydroxyisobutyrate dehydrogenase-like beta-hydroxyacid dehydrogenase